MRSSRTISFAYAPGSRWTSIARPDDPHKTLVDEKGRVLYRYHRNGDRPEFERVLSLTAHGVSDPCSVEQFTEDARTPIVHTRLHYPRVSLELTAAGHVGRDGRRVDIVSWKLSTSEPEHMTHLQIELFEPGGQSGVALRDGRVITSNDVPVLFSSAPLQPVVATNYAAIPAFATGRRILQAGTASEGVIALPLEPADSGARKRAAGAPAEQQTPSVTVAWAADALKEERKFWREQRLIRNEIRIPDDAVMDMIVSCARNILQAREIKDGVPEFQVGAALYRGLWVVDGHFILEAAQYLGYREEAVAGLKALDKHVHDDGSIAVFEFHTKETGIALLTLVRQAEICGDDTELTGRWEKIRAAVAYIDRLREQSKADGTDKPYYGLLPPSFGDGGIGGIRPEYTTTLWTLAGVSAITQAAERLGKSEDAKRFRASYEKLREAFDRAAERDMQTLPDGSRYLPMVMPGGGTRVSHSSLFDKSISEVEPDGPWDTLRPQSGTWALAHAVFPGELFDKDSPIIHGFAHLLELTDSEEGMPEGSGWAPYRALWNYAGSFYAHVWLWMHRPDKTIDYLYAFANHAAPTRVWREEQPMTADDHGYWIGDMPHNWASAEFIRIVRHLLVFERGQVLELLLGLPAEWIVISKPLVIQNTPTRYGTVSLRLSVSVDGSFELIVEREMNRPIEPRRTILYLTALKERGLHGLSIDGEAVDVEADTVASPGSVDLPARQKVRVQGSLLV